MLWSFDSNEVGQYFRCWSTCVKLVWEVPRASHTYFVDNLLAENFVSTRGQILSRYVKYVKGLLSSPSREVALVANIVARDMSSVTGRNLTLLREMTGLNPWTATPAQVREKIEPAATPEQDTWRLGLLAQYLETRRKMNTELQDTKEITSLIDSLCVN